MAFTHMHSTLQQLGLSDEHAMLFSQFLSQHGMSFEKVTGIAVSSTVPRLTATMQRMATRYLEVRYEAIPMPPFQPSRSDWSPNAR